MSTISSDLGYDGQQGQYYRLQTIMEKLFHKKVDILKMDIERHEFGVINSMANMKNAPNQIAFETHIQNSYSKWGKPVTFEEWNTLWGILDKPRNELNWLFDVAKSNNIETFYLPKSRIVHTICRM